MGSRMMKKITKGRRPIGDGDYPDLKLVEIHRAANDEEALVIKGLLESQGIHCILRSRVVHAVHPFSMDGLGEVKIMVAEIDAPEARALLSTSWKRVPRRLSKGKRFR
jgi:hypothetical protein